MKYPKLSSIKVLSEKEMSIFKGGTGHDCWGGCKAGCQGGCTPGKIKGTENQEII